MANGIQLKWSGIKEVDKVLKDLPKQVQRKVLLSAQRQVLKPVAKDMETALRAVAGKVTGNLESSIGIKALRGGKEYNAGSLAGVRYGNRYKGYHGRFIEGGTKERRPRKAKVLRFRGENGEWVFARRVAPMQKKPFMGPTIERHMARLKNDYPQAVLESLAKYMKKTLKK